MARNLLSDLHVRNAKPAAKPYRLKDGDGLFLYVAPSGVKSWQYRYKIAGKHQTLTLAKLSVMGLAEARRRADEARAAAADGKNLTTVKRVERAKTVADQAATFEVVAESWLRKVRPAPWSPAHAKQVRASIKNHLSELSGLPVAEITARVVAPILDKIARRAPLMFEKVRVRLHRILEHAVVLGAIERNPLPRPEPERRSVRKHYPALTTLPELGEILRHARATDPAKGIQRAHLLAAYTAKRIAEIVGAHWSEFNFDSATWTIPRERMKVDDAKRGDHQVPISPILLKTLREWKEADGKDAILVCPAPRDNTRPITPEGVEKYYRDVLGLKGKHSPHSWRAAFSTVSREAGKPDEVIKAQLDHQVGTRTDSAYDRAKRLDLRRTLVKWYEQQLIKARDWS